MVYKIKGGNFIGDVSRPLPGRFGERALSTVKLSLVTEPENKNRPSYLGVESGCASQLESFRGK